MKDVPNDTYEYISRHDERKDDFEFVPFFSKKRYEHTYDYKTYETNQYIYKSLGIKV